MQAGRWFLLSMCVRDKQRSVGELVPCTCVQEAKEAKEAKKAQEALGRVDASESVGSRT